MNRPSLLVLVRHAESLTNKVKKNNIYLPDDDSGCVLKGVPDHKIPITEHGWVQSRKTGMFVRDRFGLFDVVYDTNYLRTQQTREALMEAYAPEQRNLIKIRHTHLLRERERGFTHDMTAAEVNQNFPWLEHHFEMLGYFYSRPPGGQSHADVCDQVYQFIGHLFAVRAGQRVLAVAHGGTIRAIRYNLEKWTPDDFEQQAKEGASRNCGITVYAYSNETGRLELQEYDTVCP